MSFAPRLLTLLTVAARPAWSVNPAWHECEDSEVFDEDSGNWLPALPVHLNGAGTVGGGGGGDEISHMSMASRVG